MSYEKVTLSIYKKRLKDNYYSNVTGAKRALGRVQEMSDADKKAAVNAAHKHFNVELPKPKKAAKKAAKKKG